eukprot:790837-Amphidinium_carterae.1
MLHSDAHPFGLEPHTADGTAKFHSPPWLNANHTDAANDINVECNALDKCLKRVDDNDGNILEFNDDIVNDDDCAVDSIYMMSH